MITALLMKTHWVAENRADFFFLKEKTHYIYKTFKK